MANSRRETHSQGPEKQSGAQEREKQQQQLEQRTKPEITYDDPQQWNAFVMMRKMFDDMDRMFRDVGFGSSGFGRDLDFGGYGGGVGGYSGGTEQRQGAKSYSALTSWSPQLEAFRRGEPRTTEERFARSLLAELENEIDPARRRVLEAALYYGLDALRFGDVSPRYEHVGGEA